MEIRIEMRNFIFVVCLALFNNFGLSFCESENNLNKNAKIIIVGSGPSGIAAASKLMENGFTNVLILEAEDRIGGRVYTTKFGKHFTILFFSYKSKKYCILKKNFLSRNFVIYSI